MFVFTTEDSIRREASIIRRRLIPSSGAGSFGRCWKRLAAWMIFDKQEGLGARAFNSSSRAAMFELGDAWLRGNVTSDEFQKLGMEVACAWAVLPGAVEVPAAEAAAEAIALVGTAYSALSSVEGAVLAIQRYLDSRPHVRDEAQRAAILERTLSKF